jgi:hypothetical protein
VLGLSSDDARELHEAALYLRERRLGRQPEDD